MTKAFVVLLIVAAEGIAGPLKTEKPLVFAVRMFAYGYNAWSADTLLLSRDRFGSLARRYPDSAVYHYWEGVAEFHLVNLFLYSPDSLRRPAKGKRAIERAIQCFQKTLAADSGYAEAYALLGTLYGMKIEQKLYLAPFLGPKVESFVLEGRARNPDNPRIQYLIGVSYLFTPSILGGGADKAIPYFQKAESLFVQEQHASRPFDRPSWGHSTALAFLGRAYMKKKQYATAKSYFLKALKVNPSDPLAAGSLKALNAKQKE